MDNPTKKTSLLLTGSEGMLGRYLVKQFDDCDITRLNRRETPGGIACDLAESIPALPIKPFDIVIHAAGSRNNDDALKVNLEGTRHLLQALETCPPKYFVFISDAAVHGLYGAENITEETPQHVSDKVGQSKFLAEKEVSEWAQRHNVTLTILRPAPMFGSGISGEMARLFAEVANNRYIHIRGNDAHLGIVTAYDVARVAKTLYTSGGVFIVADGRNRTLVDLVEAMSANASVRKRLVYLPPKWAALGRFIPGLRHILDPDTLRRRAVTLTYNPAHLTATIPFTLYDTVEVIARRDKDYPYEDQ